MNKKIFLLWVVLLITGQLFAAQVPCLITVSADGAETAYALTDVQKIIFAPSVATANPPIVGMAVIKKTGELVSDVTRISFDTREPTGIADTKAESSVFIFPNPVKTTLTIRNVDANLKVDMYSVAGSLVQSSFTQEGSTDIDVSSLQQGTYLLRVGEQTLKFVKQ